VHYQAAAPNNLVMQALRKAGLRGLAFPPSACVMSRTGQPTAWDTRPLRHALANGILPVLYGDVVFDEVLGGTILSTEDLFVYLAHELRPARILLAGLEEGVWADFPTRQQLLGEITPETYEAMRKGLGGSAGADVTGGMESKVGQMLELVKAIPGLEAVIFSAYGPGNLSRVLKGERLGTVIIL
jgi:isopentenyl phosphate kinase